MLHPIVGAQLLTELVLHATDFVFFSKSVCGGARNHTCITQDGQFQPWKCVLCLMPESKQYVNLMLKSRDGPDACWGRKTLFLSHCCCHHSLHHCKTGLDMAGLIHGCFGNEFVVRVRSNGCLYILSRYIPSHFGGYAEIGWRFYPSHLE